MNTDRRKQLREEYKNRKPEMGILAFTSKQTGESYLFPSRDIKAGFNRIRLQLDIGSHPNAKLQAGWSQWGESGFVQTVAEQINYEQVGDVSQDDLETLLELCLARDPLAVRM